jgi:hypothetical protein
MNGPTEEGIKVAGTFVEAMKSQPLSLSLVIMNLCLLFFSWLILSSVSKQTETEINLLYAEHKEVRELLAKCVVPERVP